MPKGVGKKFARMKTLALLPAITIVVMMSNSQFQYVKKMVEKTWELFLLVNMQIPNQQSA